MALGPRAGFAGGRSSTPLLSPRRDTITEEVSWERLLPGRQDPPVGGHHRVRRSGGPPLPGLRAGLGATGYLADAAWRADGTWTRRFGDARAVRLLLSGGQHRLFLGLGREELVRSGGDLFFPASAATMRGRPGRPGPGGPARPGGRPTPWAEPTWPPRSSTKSIPWSTCTWPPSPMPLIPAA